MNISAGDGSRDRAIEDWTNLWLIHPLSRVTLQPALSAGITANTVSIAGLIAGFIASIAYFYHPLHAFAALIGLFFSVVWLVADGLDGMIARATGTSSVTGRILDGVCDHGVFLCLYLALGFSIGMEKIWPLMLTAGAFHTVQSSLYEAERTRYHRRIKGDAGAIKIVSPHTNPVVRLYESIFHALDGWAGKFDARLRTSADKQHLATRYRNSARLPMKLMALLSANMRVVTIFIACLIGDPALFWWVEIGPLTLVALVGIFWHRHIERHLAD